jgi:hypothetical protein
MHEPVTLCTLNQTLFLSLNVYSMAQLARLSLYTWDWQIFLQRGRMAMFRSGSGPERRTIQIL